MDNTILKLENETSCVSLNLLDAGKKVAEIEIVIERDYCPIKGEIFPKTWFDKQNKIKPFLQILGIITFENKNKGYGRIMLQKAYEISKANGCEGRIKVDATWGSGTFYEHCGFVTPTKNKIGKEGTKYFIPTEKNLKILYAKQNKSVEIKQSSPIDWKGFDINKIFSGGMQL